MIPLTDTHFEFERIRPDIVGAGVLPVAVAPNGSVCLLLGKERYINHWRGSLKWSGFEGGRKSGEDIEFTAAREFIEESLGVVGFSGEEPTIEQVFGKLRRGEYVARIVLCILHDHDVEHRYHVTYVLKVPYDTWYGERFLARRRELIDVQAKTQQLAKLTECIRATRLPCEGGVYDECCVVGITRVERLAWRRMRVAFVDDNADAHIYEMDDVEEEESAAYMSWFATRQTCTADLKRLDFCRDAIVAECDAQHTVVSAKVNDDYLEKQSVQWWGIEDLHTVLGNGGYMHSDFFRAYFLPILQRTLVELSAEVDADGRSVAADGGNSASLPTSKDIYITTTTDSIRAFMSSAPASRQQITCFRCGEQGHYKSECFHWKTRQCWHYENATCRDVNCSFAHGAHEMRTPWMPRCIRIVKKDGQLICLGCKAYGHTYKYCPYKVQRSVQN